MLFKNWKTCLLDINETLSDAISKLEIIEKKIILVTKNDNLLAGTITDGDIRRAIIDNVDMESPVSKVMRKDPVSANYNISKNELISLMSDKNLLAIPIVDENGKVIMDDAKNFPSPENMNLRDRLFDIRTVDVRLTFRSKNPFYEDDLARDPNDPTNSVKRKVYGLQRVYEPGDNTLDKYLRDSVIVTVNTRNIGQAFQ